MSWIRIDDGFADHPKLAALGALRSLAGWLHIAGLCYVSRHLTDGFIPTAQVRLLADFRYIGYETGGVEGLFSVGEEADAEVLAAALVRVGIWHETNGGYAVHDYLDYNPSRDDVMAARDRNAQYQRAHRRRKASSKATGKGPVILSPSPTPTPTTESKSTALSGSRPTMDGKAVLRDAETILEFLNQKAGRTFQAREATGKPTANLQFIVARLKAGATIGDCKAVIARKVREWRGTEQEQYLRPETLFNRTKFESYRGQRLRARQNEGEGAGHTEIAPPLVGPSAKAAIRPAGSGPEEDRQP